MKKLFMLFGLFLTANFCFAQPSIDDLYAEIDAIDFSPFPIGVSGPLEETLRGIVDPAFSSLTPIRRNNITITPPPGSAWEYTHCPCGYKWVTRNLIDIMDPVLITTNQSSGILSPEEQQEFTKKILEQIMNWMRMQGIRIEDVKEIHALYINGQSLQANTGKGNGDPNSLYADKFHITYRVCVPCPH